VLTTVLQQLKSRKLVLRGSSVTRIIHGFYPLVGFTNPCIDNGTLIELTETGTTLHQVLIVELMNGKRFIVDMAAPQLDIFTFSAEGYPLLVSEIMNDTNNVPVEFKALMEPGSKVSVEEIPSELVLQLKLEQCQAAMAAHSNHKEAERFLQQDLEWDKTLVKETLKTLG